MSASRSITLDGELQSLMEAIRGNPTDTRLRIHLAQLSMLLGQWTRALNQLQTVALTDAAALPFAQAYREAIRCETTRSAVFAGSAQPAFLGQPRQWQALLARALQLRAANDHAQADALQAQAFDLAQPVPFLVDDQRVDWIADADARLGPCCELFINGQYVWVPFQDIALLETDPPEDLRDLAWLPARLTLCNGGQHAVMVPTRYPGSEHHDDDGVRRAARTLWQPLGEGAWAGLGQRMWASDRGEHPLLDTRRLQAVAAGDSDGATA